MLTLNGFAQAALLLAWILLRRRIRVRADATEIAFPSAQYSLALRTPEAYAAPRTVVGEHQEVSRSLSCGIWGAVRGHLHTHRGGSVMRLTAEAYDLLEWENALVFGIAGTVVGLVASFVLQTDVPLLLHTLLWARQLWRHPLAGVHVRHQNVIRTWVSFNPFL